MLSWCLLGVSDTNSVVVCGVCWGLMLRCCLFGFDALLGSDVPLVSDTPLLSVASARCVRYFVVVCVVYLGLMLCWGLMLRWMLCWGLMLCSCLCRVAATIPDGDGPVRLVP